MITCYSKDDSKLKVYETNPKRLKPTKSTAASLNTLPSKFQKDDRERILENLTPKVLATFFENIMMGLSDCMLILTLPKLALKQVKPISLKLIRGYTRCAYNTDTLEKATVYFLEVLTHLKGGINQIANNEEQREVINSILHFQLASPMLNTTSSQTQQ